MVAALLILLVMVGVGVVFESQPKRPLLVLAGVNSIGLAGWQMQGLNR